MRCTNLILIRGSFSGPQPGAVRAAAAAEAPVRPGGPGHRLRGGDVLVLVLLPVLLVLEPSWADLIADLQDHHINVHKVVMAACSKFFKDQLCKVNVQVMDWAIAIAL